MSETSEHQKSILIWRLRRDLENLKNLCMAFDQKGINKSDLRKFLVEMNCYYEDLRRRLHDA